MYVRVQVSIAESNDGIQALELDVWINVYMYVRCQFSNADSNVVI